MFMKYADTKNADIRSEMLFRVKGLPRQIPLWAVAERLGIHENTLRIWLRKEIEGEKKQRILSAIYKIQSELQEETEVNAR